jgi:hypothetical protein
MLSVEHQRFIAGTCGDRVVHPHMANRVSVHMDEAEN